MSFALPPDLAGALDRLTEGLSGRRLAERAQAISAHYRADRPSGGVIRDHLDTAAYALTRMPATYAAVSAALAALANRATAFHPLSLADVGCGPGTASLAALSCFESLAALTLIDSNAAMLALTRHLLAPDRAKASVQLADLASIAPPLSDLVVAAYVLIEMADGTAADVVRRLWLAARGALVIVEPGTPRGWRRMMTFRSILLDLGARIAAPCPHPAPCPMVEPDWCHFNQRLPRLRAHRAAKGADAPYEDEKFTYLAAVRPEVDLTRGGARVLAQPVVDKAEARLKLCLPIGEAEIRRIPRRDKVVFGSVRRTRWGDSLDV
jgi:ribosomal protein RSM22 (predicted rRNA methylase)